jgi:hypothetical protein
MRTADLTGGKPIAVIAVYLYVCAINPLVAFYDIHGGICFYDMKNLNLQTVKKIPLPFHRLSLFLFGLL